MQYEVNKTYILKLDEKEAQWLKRVMQNPIGFDTLDEPIYDHEMRKMLWDALSDVELF